jgi:hypothetical protein
MRKRSAEGSRPKGGNFHFTEGASSSIGFFILNECELPRRWLESQSGFIRIWHRRISQESSRLNNWLRAENGSSPVDERRRRRAFDRGEPLRTKVKGAIDVPRFSW